MEQTRDPPRRAARVAAPLLARVQGPALVVDEHGWVAAATGTAVRERVGVPTDGDTVGVHGIGACRAEHVPGGWFLRPVGPSDADTRMRLRLDLTARPAQAVVEGTSLWTYPLSRRHAQILALLVVAGQGGLDAAALSQALYGDRDHLVTVRAEVSRLRRSLGGLLRARPYRLASDVEAVPVDPADLHAVLRPA